jgi:hypothetical protein
VKNRSRFRPRERLSTSIAFLGEVMCYVNAFIRNGVSELQALAQARCMQTPDFKGVKSAFMEKRPQPFNKD